MLKWSSSGAAHSPFISAVTRSFMEFNPRAGIMMMTITVMLIKKSIIITLIKSPRQQRSTPRREMMQINCKDEAIRRAEEEEQGSQSGRMARAACLLTKIFLPTHTLTDNLDCSVAELIGWNNSFECEMLESAALQGDDLGCSSREANGEWTLAAASQRQGDLVRSPQVWCDFMLILKQSCL